MAQRSPDWRLARLGKAKSSRIADVIARTKSGYSTSRANYAAQLACERLTGIPAESYLNAAMAWGVEKEPEARRRSPAFAGACSEIPARSERSGRAASHGIRGIGGMPNCALASIAGDSNLRDPS